MLLNETSNETSSTNNYISVYLKGLGWVNKSSTITCDTGIFFSILERFNVYEIISKYNVPYLTNVVEDENNRKKWTY